MRTLLTLFLILTVRLALPGQSAEEQVMRLKLQENGSAGEIATSDGEVTAPGEEKPGSWNFSVGTSYSYSKAFGSGMMIYAAPTYTLSLNDRWSLHGGVIASRYQGLNRTFFGESLYQGSFSSMALFAAASYRMNDRLILHGAGVKQLISAPASPFTPYPMDNLSLGATYMLGDHITIGATIHLNNGQNYYSNPFNGTMFRSPYIW